jgi:hypothetical protein
MKVTVNEYKSCNQLKGLAPPGEFWAYLSGIGPGYSVADGLNPGYCSDLFGGVADNPLFGPVTYQAKLWSSLDPDTPNSSTIPWNKINYLINMYPVPNANYTWLEIQAAIWELVHRCSPGGPFFECPPERVNPYYFPFGSSGAGPYGCSPGFVNISKVNQIFSDADANGGNFISDPSEKIAVVIQILSCEGNTVAGACDPPYQIVFIPVQCLPCTGTIGDFVWHDVNHNGIQDDGSASGINGVEVLLTGTDAYGHSISLSDVTTNNPSTGNPGYYQFEGLCQGNYTVSVNAATVSGGLVPTSPLGGSGDDNVPNDSNQPTGTTVTLTTDSASNQTIDFGYISPCTGSIGDYVWQDLNYNGIQDEGAASGINGVEILLTGMNVYGQSVSMTFTTINNPSMGNPGYYQFSGLCQGNYTVSVNPATVPAGLAPTFPLSSNGSDANGTDSNNPGGTTVNFPDDSTSNQTIDFGYISPCTGSIGDYVWQDLNHNGIQDDGAASGINGVQILLTGMNVYGQSVSMTFTTINNPSTGNPGYYQFSGLCQGNYTVSVSPATVPAGLAPTFPVSSNGNDANGTDSNNPGATTVNFPDDSTSNQTIDFGYISPCMGSIGDYVWQDLNYNGIQDDGAASGINGVQILLTGINVYGQPVSMIATTANAPSTGNPGYYQFAGLCAGNYTVSINATTVPAGLIPTSPLSANGNDLVPNDSNNPIGATLSLGTDNDSNQTIDFGYVMATPGIVVTKACTDASAAGQPINFSAVITNTGNETLNNITCSDDKAGTLIVPVPSLVPGASTTVTGSYVPTTSLSTDTVTCSGTGAISNKSVSNSGSATCKINTAIGRGDTATIGFWHNKNGQALILSFNGGGSSTKLGDWLAATFPCLYGSLAGKQNSVVALQFLTYFNVKGQKTYAQILAGALASYATSSTLAGGNMAAAYGFNVSSTGTGAKTYNVGSNGTAIGLANNTSYTVLQLLKAANQKCPFGTSGAVFDALNTIFDGINQSGDIQ